MQTSIRKFGYWTSLIGIMLTLVYLGAIAGMFLSGTIPPAEPYVSIISIVSLASVPIFVFLWVLLHNVVSLDKKIFTQTSLALIVIFATLTSINRYVALTVIRQSIDMGITNGLNWVMPYGWPSIMAAMEVLAWGFFLGLAFLSLAPVFRNGKTEPAIFWTLIISGFFFIDCSTRTNIEFSNVEHAWDHCLGTGFDRFIFSPGSLVQKFKTNSIKIPMDKQTKTLSILILITLILFAFLFVFFTYTFLHESGHAITGLLFGQLLTEFDVSFWALSAHVGLVGGALTESQLAVQAVAGAGLPLIIWAIFISLVPRKASFTLEVLKLLSSMMVVNTLLAWIILPILFLLEKAPSDDVTNFLRHSQMPPLLLTFIASAIYTGGWTVFLSKIDGLRNELLLFNTTDRKQLTAGTRKTVPAMASMMALFIFSASVLNSSVDKHLLNSFSPPQGFTPIAQLDLSKQAYPSVTLTQFTLAKSTYVGVFITVKEINTTYFDLSVAGADGYSSTVLHGEGYNAFQDGGLWEENLPAGTYQVMLTSHQSPGIASVYIKTH